MTIFKSIQDIKVGDRFRKDLGNIDELSRSINELGLLQYPAVTQDNYLIHGARRMQACNLLGWDEIPVNVIPITTENLIKADIFYLV